ncbi:phage holin family protein [Streptomyces orinoci]|uniref:Phage holin family protein n=1 Tax=Streptomyces orinoci TaxID=67339 RepID=A0ABV3K6P8_STRON|nr:phage holin family protein [Streptomyces orinoci]
MTGDAQGHGPASHRAANGRWLDAGERLWRDVAAVVRQDVGPAREEAVATARETALATAALALSGACGVLALVSAHQAVLRAMERHWPPHRAAWALAAGYASGAAVLAWCGCGKAQEARRASREALGRVLPD